LDYVLATDNLFKLINHPKTFHCFIELTPGPITAQPKKALFSKFHPGAGKSLDTLTWLLDQTSTEEVKSTLTIWGTDDMTAGTHASSAS
jgi:hypothetical protein